MPPIPPRSDYSIDQMLSDLGITSTAVVPQTSSTLSVPPDLSAITDSSYGAVPVPTASNPNSGFPLDLPPPPHSNHVPMPPLGIPAAASSSITQPLQIVHAGCPSSLPSQPNPSQDLRKRFKMLAQINLALQKRVMELEKKEQNRASSEKQVSQQLQKALKQISALEQRVAASERSEQNMFRYVQQLDATIKNLTTVQQQINAHNKRVDGLVA